MSIDSLFEGVNKGVAAYEVTKQFQGKLPMLKLAIVADVNDPAGLGRIKCYLPEKGGKSTTPWLMRMSQPGVQFPLARVGDTVGVLFAEGDTVNGVWLGNVQNLTSPPIVADGLAFQFNGATVVLGLDGSVTINSPTRVTIAAPLLAISATVVDIRTPWFLINDQMVQSRALTDEEQQQLAATLAALPTGVQQ